LRAHWSAVLAADFFTTEVWTARGLVTFYTVFTIELCSRRVRMLGTTPAPDEAFMLQIVRNLKSEVDGPRIFLCDRDRKWNRAVRQLLEDGGFQVVQTPFRAPNANAYAERFVRSVKEECLNRIIPLGERYFRYALREFLLHYHRERNHQGVGNALIEPATHTHGSGAVWRRKPLAGLLSYYHRAA
jgi:transposase InsO family protein